MHEKLRSTLLATSPLRSNQRFRSAKSAVRNVCVRRRQSAVQYLFLFINRRHTQNTADLFSFFFLTFDLKARNPEACGTEKHKALYQPGLNCVAIDVFVRQGRPYEKSAFVGVSLRFNTYFFSLTADTRRIPQTFLFFFSPST